MPSESAALNARDEMTKKETDKPDEIEFLNARLQVLTDALLATPDAVELLKERLHVLGRLWTLVYSKVCTQPWQNAATIERGISDAKRELYETGETR